MKIFSEKSWQKHLSKIASDAAIMAKSKFQEGYVTGLARQRAETDEWVAKMERKTDEVDNLIGAWRKLIAEINQTRIEPESDQRMVVLKTVVATYMLIDDSACREIAQSITDSTFRILKKQMEKGNRKPMEAECKPPSSPL